MKTKTHLTTTLAASLFVLLGASTGSAIAQVYGDTGGYDAPEYHAASTKTRAEVLAELQQARANSEIATNSEGYSYAPRATAPTSAKTRQQVRAETLEAMKSRPLSQGNRTDLSPY